MKQEIDNLFREDSQQILLLLVLTLKLSASNGLLPLPMLSSCQRALRTVEYFWMNEATSHYLDSLIKTTIYRIRSSA